MNACCLARCSARRCSYRRVGRSRLPLITLNADARSILERVAQASEPVAMSSFFHTICPPDFDVSASEDDPDRVVWHERQIGLFQAVVGLCEAGLVKVVHPANGARPDLVVLTRLATLP